MPIFNGARRMGELRECLTLRCRTNEIRSFRAVRSKPTGLRAPSDECRVTRLSEPSFDLAAVFSASWQDCHATGQIGSDLMVLKNISTIESL